MYHSPDPNYPSPGNKPNAANGFSRPADVIDDIPLRISALLCDEGLHADINIEDLPALARDNLPTVAQAMRRLAARLDAFAQAEEDAFEYEESDGLGGQTEVEESASDDGSNADSYREVLDESATDLEDCDVELEPEEVAEAQMMEESKQNSMEGVDNSTPEVYDEAGFLLESASLAAHTHRESDANSILSFVASLPKDTSGSQEFAEKDEANCLQHRTESLSSGTQIPSDKEVTAGNETSAESSNAQALHLEDLPSPSVLKSFASARAYMRRQANNVDAATSVPQSKTKSLSAVAEIDTLSSGHLHTTATSHDAILESQSINGLSVTCTTGSSLNPLGEYSSSRDPAHVFYDVSVTQANMRADRGSHHLTGEVEEISQNTATSAESPVARISPQLVAKSQEMMRELSIAQLTDLVGGAIDDSLPGLGLDAEMETAQPRTDRLPDKLLAVELGEGQMVQKQITTVYNRSTSPQRFHSPVVGFAEMEELAPFSLSPVTETGPIQTITEGTTSTEEGRSKTAKAKNGLKNALRPFGALVKHTKLRGRSLIGKKVRVRKDSIDPKSLKEKVLSAFEHCPMEDKVMAREFCMEAVVNSLLSEIEDA